MTKATPIKATFADFRLIKGRKQAQFVFELPIEQADAALKALGGLPQSVAERWCAVVLLDLSKASATMPDTAAEPVKDRRKFHDLPLPQQAGMLCADPAFQQFLVERYDGFKNEEDAATTLREICGVKSRSELATNAKAAADFRNLAGEFDFWRTVVV